MYVDWLTVWFTGFLFWVLYYLVTKRRFWEALLALVAAGTVYWGLLHLREALLGF